MIQKLFAMSQTPAHGEGEPSKLSNLSTLALLLGLTALAIILFSGSFAVGILAVIVGHIARRQIRRSVTPMRGAGMAMAGLTLGYLALLLSALDIMESRSRRHGMANHISLQSAIALESAIQNFHIEYDTLPALVHRVTTNTEAGAKLLTTLLGIEESSGSVRNRRQIKFLSVREGTSKRNGLIYSADGRSIEGLYDVWGNPFTVELDINNDELLHFSLGSKTIDLKNRRIAVYSPGEDQKLGTSDDIKTW